MITVVGSGVRSPEQMTIQALNILKQSKKTLIIPDNEAQILSFVKQQQLPNVENIRRLYKNGNRDMENYIAILKKILVEHDLHKEVCFVVAGHPMMGVSLISMLISKVGKENVAIVEGVSSFCTMVTDLNIDPIADGCAIFDANRIILKNIHIEPSSHVFLYHVCSVATPHTWLLDPTNENALTLLKQHLLKFYSPHDVVQIISSKQEGVRAEIFSGTIKNLEDLGPMISFATTMYLPPSKNRLKTKFNKEFLRQYIKTRFNKDTSDEQIDYLRVTMENRV